MICTSTANRVLFKVFLPHAANVELVGDFTEWRASPIQMRRESPGWWLIEADIPAGEHHFCYLIDGHIWLADYAAHGVRLNGFGGWVSRVLVEAVHPQIIAPAAANTA